MNLDIVKEWNMIRLENPNDLYLVIEGNTFVIKEIDTDKIVKIIEKNKES